MPRQTLIFATVSASLLPIGMLMVLALNPRASFATGVQVILDRGRENPMLWFRLIALMMLFAVLGAGLSRLVSRRKLKSARGFEVNAKPPRQ